MVSRPSKNRLLAILTVCGLVGVAGFAAIEASEQPSLEGQLLADAENGELDEFSLLEGALIASGVADRSALRRYADRFAAELPALADALQNAEPASTRAEVVLRFLHEELLVGEYDERCTEINPVLDEGDYNCVSATVLYQCLCREFGLSPVAVATNSHVRSRFGHEVTFDVETTCGQWFERAAEDPNAQIFRTQFEATRQLSEVELLAKVYYNRAISLLEETRFAKAVELLRIAHRLDPQDRSAAENFVAAMNNWALFESDHRRFERAAELIREGLAAHPDYDPFLANDLYVHQRWTLQLCQQQRFDKAIAVLDQAYARRSDVELFDRGRIAVYRRWAESLLVAGSHERAWELFATVRQRFGDDSEVLRSETAAIDAAIETLVDSGDCEAAQTLVVRGLQLQANHPSLLRQQRRLTSRDS
jgi:tetratricopeptide (TPR) repeat protein